MIGLKQMKITKRWIVVEGKEERSQPEDYFDFVECFGIALLSMGYGGTVRKEVEGAASSIDIPTTDKGIHDS